MARAEQIGRRLATGFAGAALALAGVSAAAAQPTCDGDGPHLTVIVDGLQNSHGYISVELYPDDPKQFLSHNAQLVVAHDKLEKAAATVCLDVPKPGAYALAVYHDENGDDQFNRNSLGLPAEGFGLSNNPKILFGLPPFSAVRFTIDKAETTMHVALRYLIGHSAPH